MPYGARRGCRPLATVRAEFGIHLSALRPSASVRVLLLVGRPCPPMRYAARQPDSGTAARKIQWLAMATRAVIARAQQRK